MSFRRGSSRSASIVDSDSTMGGGGGTAPPSGADIELGQQQSRPLLGDDVLANGAVSPHPPPPPGEGASHGLDYPPSPGMVKRRGSDDAFDMSKGKGGSKTEMAQMLFYLTAFSLSGPLLIMSNKHVLSDVGFAFPLSLSFLTLTFSWAVCWVAIRVGLVDFKHKDMVDRKFYVTNIMPIGALSAGTIVLGMASYLFLTVSFVQMLKAFTPVMTLAFMTSFGLTRPTREIIGCVMVICLGTAFAGLGELNFSLLGMGCMLSAQMCEALKLVFTQLMLKNFKFNVVETLYYVTPISAAWVLLFVIIVELRHFDSTTWDMFINNKGAFLFSSVMAISTNAINAVVIQHTNALMLKLVATARNGVLVLFNAAVMGEVVTGIQFCGYSVSLVGFLFYNALIRRGNTKSSGGGGSSNIGKPSELASVKQ